VHRHAPPGYDCPFCKVAAGEENPPWTLLADVVWRDGATTAWVNRRWWVNNPGAVVVVPNQHVESIYEVDRALAGEVHEAARRLAIAMKEAYSCEGISTRQHNEPAGYQEVWHYHLHVFPRWHGDELYASPHRLTTADERKPYADRLRRTIGSWPGRSDT
jgi:histidine triad (HIT) family protein